MSILKLIEKSLISIDSECLSKDEVIEEIVNTMMLNARASDKRKLMSDLLVREAEVSTSMGLDIAIPHAQSATVLQSSLVFVKLKSAIDWDGDNVKLVFGIFVSQDNFDNQHLKILSTLARKLTDESFRQSLINVLNIDEAFEKLEFMTCI